MSENYFEDEAYMPGQVPDGKTPKTQTFTKGESADVIGIIDQYEILKELGTGGFGSVYLARDTTSRTLVAVKGLPPAVCDSAEEVETIRDNFQLIAGLKHPNVTAALVLHKASIVDWRDSGASKRFNVKPGDVMLVMDYAPGMTLRSWQRRFPDRRVPLAQALEIARQVASSLDFAHGEKIIHRDVKPENVMVEPFEDGSFKVRVLDFGLASAVRSSLNRSKKGSGNEGETSGTPQYMAPEQWVGRRQGRETDQYALAVLVCEMLTGEVPFQSAFDNLKGEQQASVVTTQPPDLPPDLPHSVARALKKALAKKREDRFRTCGDFVAALGGKRQAASAPLWLGLGAAALAAVIAVGIFGNGKRASSVPAPAVPAAVTEKAKEARERAAEAERERLAARQRKSGGLYKVVDLTDNTTIYLDAVPSGGWTDEYKTSKIVLRRIEPGTFTMGSHSGEEGRFDDENSHEVTLTKPYYIGVFEVTQGQWERVMGSNPSTYKSETRPVEGVAYDDVRGKVKGSNWPNSGAVDAESFLGRLRSKTSEAGFDLPTEAQWEYACRAGTRTSLPNGRDLRIVGVNNGPALDDIAWYGGNSGVDFELSNGWNSSGWKEKQYNHSRAGTHPVGLKEPNRWGLYDTIGNVWEWCSDWKGDYDGNATDPTGPSSGTFRVCRGGSWFNNARYCRSAYRCRSSPGFRNIYLGIRVCCSAGPLE